MAQKQLVHRRSVIDAKEDERRIEAQRAERACRHAVVDTGVVASREDRDTGGKASEHAAEGVGVDHDAAAVVRGAKGENTFQRYDSRTTSVAGTKSPVTPMSRSASALRTERFLAARLISGAEPTTAP